jgi:hypothetical protein
MRCPDVTGPMISNLSRWYAVTYTAHRPLPFNSSVPLIPADMHRTAGAARTEGTSLPCTLL